MPSAVASFDDAFDMDEPARKKVPRPCAAPDNRPARKRGGKKVPRFAFAVDGGRVVRLSAIAMSGTLVVAIMVNALLLQKGHHPAPLFGKSIALGPSPVPKAPPAERVTPVVAPEAEITPPSLAPVAQGRTALAEAPASSDDAIGALIQGHTPSTAAKGENKTVLGAQKALAKLGFALKPSGTLGPQTRKAIEAFERDRHLPVKGELSHRVVKILAAESGVRID